MIKKHLNAVLLFLKLKKNKTTKAQNEKSRTLDSVIYLSENDWFNKQFEKQFNAPISKDVLPFSSLEKRLSHDFKRRRSYQPDIQPPRTDDYPDVVWNGPLLESCLCYSSEGCACKGHMVLPKRCLPYAIPERWFYLLRPLEFKSKKIGLIHLPELSNNQTGESLALQLKEHLEIEEKLQQKLKEMNFDRGPEFCFDRCLHYYYPTGHQLDSYFKLIKEMYDTVKHEIYLAKELASRAKKPIPISMPKGAPEIADSFTEGFYRSASTQAYTDDNGEFIIGNVSHILFGKNLTCFQDIEGKRLCVYSYQEISEKETVVKKFENLLSLNRIKNKVSKLTCTLMSSLMGIEDPGIPINTRETQDPPLDDSYESIIIPSNKTFVNEIIRGECPCNKNKETLDYHTNIPLQNPLPSDIEGIPGKGLRGYIDESIAKKNGIPSPPTNTKNKSGHGNNKDIKKNTKLNIGDDDQLQTAGKLTVTKDKKGVKENEIKQNTPNDQNYVTDKEIILEDGTKFKEGSDDIIKIKKMKSTEIKKIAIKNNKQQKSVELIDSIKPKDELHNRKMSVDSYIASLLEELVFSRVDQGICLFKREQTSSDEIIKDDLLETVEDSAAPNLKLDTDEKVETNVREGNIFESLKFKRNISDFTEFIKKQTNSLTRMFRRNIGECSQLRTRKVLSMEQVKLKINKNSFKKIKSTLSSFFRSRWIKSSIVMKDLLKLKKKSENINRPNDTKSKQNSEIKVYSIQNLPDSKISEKEVFSLRYRNSFDISSSSDTQ